MELCSNKEKYYLWSKVGICNEFCKYPVNNIPVEGVLKPLKLTFTIFCAVVELAHDKHISGTSTD